MDYPILLVTLILRGVNNKFVYHQLRLDKKYLIKDCIGLLNLYGNYGAKVIEIKIMKGGQLC